MVATFGLHVVRVLGWPQKLRGGREFWRFLSMGSGIVRLTVRVGFQRVAYRV